MLSREDAIAKFIDEYNIEVPADKVDQECDLLLRSYRRKNMYAQLSDQFSPDAFDYEITEAAVKEIRQSAIHQLKEDLVFKRIMAEQNFSVSDDELIDYANNMTQKEKTSIEMIKNFFDNDFALLKDDIRRKKAGDWMAEQINK